MASPLSRHDTPPVPNAESGASSFVGCGNCGAPLSGPFCSQCGEKKISPKDYTVAHLVDEAIGDLTSFDSRFLRTLKLLFTKPGALSIAYFHGELRGALQRESSDQKKSLVIVSVPVLALFMTLFFAGSGRTYAEHLIFSVQVYAFLLSFLAAVVVLMFYPATMLLRATGPAADPIRRFFETELGITVFVITGLTIYMYLGFRRAYGASRLRAARSALILPWVVAYLTGVYHTALFYVTFWTT